MRPPSILAIAIVLATAASCPNWLYAQGFSDRMGEFLMMRYDRNRNGQLDVDEIDQLPENMLDFLEDNGVDLSRPISRELFVDLAPEMMQAIRGGTGGGTAGGFAPGGFQGRGGFEGRGGEEGRGGFGRGGFDRGSFGGRDGGEGRDFGRGRGGFSRDGRDGGEGRDMGRGRGRGGWGADRDGGDPRSGGNAQAPKPRVTVDLPERFRHLDLDGDGQIGLYEWGRAGYADFVRLDRNGDGFLTPQELADPPAGVEIRVPSGPRSNESAQLASAASPPGNASAGSSNSTSAAGRSTAGNPRTNQFSRRRTMGTSGGNSAAPSRPGGTSTSNDLDDSDSDDDSSSSGDNEDPNITTGRTLFTALDVNKDGSLTEDEWKRSRLARQQFESAGVALALPVSVEQFIEKYVEMRTKSR